LTEVSTAHWRRLIDMTGALVVGRLLLDFTEGWGGVRPMDKPVVVFSHTVPAVGLGRCAVHLREQGAPVSVIERTDVTHLRYRVVRR
jgi:hypothetical protein